MACIPSTSSSLAIVIVGVLLGVGALYSATAGAFERVDAATDDRIIEYQHQQRTTINLTRAAWRNDEDATTGNEYLNIYINNTGATVLGLGPVDLLIDGLYFDHATNPNVTTAVEQDAATTVWAPGETLHITVDDGALDDTLNLQGDTQPQRVKIVVESGIAEWTRVTDPDPGIAG